eukprot:6044359-Prymnesium_polylepis.1
MAGVFSVLRQIGQALGTWVWARLHGSFPPPTHILAARPRALKLDQKVPRPGTWGCGWAQPH